MEIINTLGLDWKLLIAQAVNFFLLLILLSKFVYKPVINTLKKRQTLVENSVKDAKKIEERLVALEKERAETMATASKEAMVILENAKITADKLRNESLEDTKKEIALIHEKYKKTLESDKTEMFNSLKKEIAEIILLSSGKIVQREFTEADQKRLLNALSDELKSVKI